METDLSWVRSLGCIWEFCLMSLCLLASLFCAVTWTCCCLRFLAALLSSSRVGTFSPCRCGLWDFERWRLKFSVAVKCYSLHFPLKGLTVYAYENPYDVSHFRGSFIKGINRIDVWTYFSCWFPGLATHDGSAFLWIGLRFWGRVRVEGGPARKGR